MTPKLLTRQQAAKLCNISANTFDKWVRAGIVPKPLKGTKRWYIKAMEHYFDISSGLAALNDDEYDPDLENRIELWDSSR